MDNVNIIGCLENVSLSELGVTNVLAKIDTGAFSGALHCTDVHVVRRRATRERVLKFIPLGKKRLATETTVFMSTYVRSATGHRVKRFIIDTTIEIDGVKYPIRIGLSDRSDLKRPDRSH